jgi:hypothetical protein
MKGLWQNTICQQDGKGWETHWKARGRCQEGGGDAARTRQTTQPINIKYDKLSPYN